MKRMLLFNHEKNAIETARDFQKFTIQFLIMEYMMRTSNFIKELLDEEDEEESKEEITEEMTDHFLTSLSESTFFIKN